MNINHLITIIGTIPLFSLRTFFPAFLMALFFAHPEWFPNISNNADIYANENFWQQNWLVILLGTLSLLEFIADKNSSLRIFLHEAEPYMKPISYLAIQIFALNANNTQVLNSIQWAGFNPLIILAFVATFVVYFLANIRKNTLNWLKNVDFDDSLKIGNIISWIEDSLITFGFILLIISGIFMIIIYSIIILIAFLIRRYYKIKVEKSKIKCSNCSNKVFPFAVFCQYCNAKNENIKNISILGNVKQSSVKNLKSHQINLLSQHRCPNCGTISKNNKTLPKCKECNTEFFVEPSIEEFIQAQQSLFLKALALSFILGFIPFLGFIISSAYTNIYVISPFKRYLTNFNSALVNIVSKLMFFIFILFGTVLGFLAAPLFCFIKYYMVKNQFLKKYKVKNNSFKIINSIF